MIWLATPRCASLIPPSPVFSQSVEHDCTHGRIQIDHLVYPSHEHRCGIELDSAGPEPLPRRLDQRGTTPGKGVQNDSSPRGVGDKQGFGELRRELSGPWKGIGPYAFGDVEVALRERLPVQGGSGEGFVQEHARRRMLADGVGKPNTSALRAECALRRGSRRARSGREFQYRNSSASRSGQYSQPTGPINLLTPLWPTAISPTAPAAPAPSPSPPARGADR